MEKTRRRLGLVIASALIASAGCSDGAGLIHREDLATEHDYGVTACPQELGEIEVELAASAPEAVTLAVREEMSTIDVLDPDFGWPLDRDYTTDLHPGEILVFPVQFNCGSDVDVEGSVLLETFAWSDGVSLERASIPIVLDVRVAP